MSKAYFHYKAGKKLYQKKDFLRAIMHLEQAKKEQPHKASIREFLAIAYYNCHFYKEAEQYFESVLQIDAVNDFAHYGLGLAMAKLGKTDRARGQLKLATIMNPGCEEYKRALKKLSYSSK